MLIALERWDAGLDTQEWFADLPDGACQEPHWGYCRRARSPCASPTASHWISAGDAYYIRPGHNAHIDEDAEFVEFTQADQTPGDQHRGDQSRPCPIRPGGDGRRVNGRRHTLNG